MRLYKILYIIYNIISRIGSWRYWIYADCIKQYDIFLTDEHSF